MANELSILYSSGSTLYAIIRRKSDSYVWNGTAFAAWNNANIATYDVALTDNSGDYYSANFPSAITAGVYIVFYYLQAGGTPATTDTIIPPPEEIEWTGTVAQPSSTSVGFHPERIFSVWVQDYDRLTVISEAELSRKIEVYGTQSGVPRYISFDEFGTGTLYPTPDDAYTIKCQWWPPLVNFTAGDSSAGTIVVNIAGDLAARAVQTGGAAILKYGSLDAAPLTDRLRAVYENIVVTASGAGTLGVRSIRRKSLSEVNSERWS